MEGLQSYRQRPWLVWPDSRQPHLRRPGYLPRPPFHEFRTFGEAVEFVILRWARHYDRHDPHQDPKTPT